MQEASPEDAGLEVHGRRGDRPYESGKREPSRLAGLERERAALEMFASVAAHELMAPLIASETRARLLDDQLRDRDVGRASADLQDLIRGLSRMRQLVETLLHDARSCGVPLERKPVNLQQLVTDAIESLDARDPRLRGPRPCRRAAGRRGRQRAARSRGQQPPPQRAALRPRNGGDVRIRARRERAQWRISVTSQGATIPAEDRSGIFEPYSRGTHANRGRRTWPGDLPLDRRAPRRHHRRRARPRRRQPLLLHDPRHPPPDQGGPGTPTS